MVPQSEHDERRLSRTVISGLGWGPISSDGSTLYYGGEGISSATRSSKPVLQMAKASWIDTRDLGFPGIPTASRSLPDDRWLAVPLKDGATTNISAMPTDGGPMRQIADFGQRTILIARSVSWSGDSRSVYAAAAEMNAESCSWRASASRPSDSFHRVSTLPPEWRLFR